MCIKNICKSSKSITVQSKKIERVCDKLCF